jgi:hypothetical protein
LVLDYTVKPTVADIGGVETWWQEKYGVHPDLALILPWRYDPEKGLNVPEVKRLETKSLLFNPLNPMPGDDVTISARIHNYSLVQILQPVTVHFYNGDPNDGGDYIGEVELTGGLESRKSRIADIQWTLPTSANDGFYRIYAVLDPADDMVELHENNNIGWRNMILDIEATDIVEEEISTVRNFELVQNYPNPFNPVTTIEFMLPRAGQVKIDVFNALGQKVKTLSDSFRQAGRHELRFEAAGLASGVYYYRIQTGPFSDVRKMVLLR